MLPSNAVDEVEAHVKYEGYIKRQKIDIERLEKRNTPIPQTLNYESVVALNEETKVVGSSQKALHVHRDFGVLQPYFDGSRKKENSSWIVTKKTNFFIQITFSVLEPHTQPCFKNQATNLEEHI